MVPPVVRPMTIAAATSLIAGSISTPVYADEKDRDEHHRERPHSDLSHEYKARHFRATGPNSGHETLVLAPDEQLMPGLALVAIAAFAGSLVVRQRAPLVKILTPFAFASVAGCYFLPHTTRNLLGIDQALYDKWTSTHPHSHVLHSSKTEQHSQTSTDVLRSELASKAHEVWRAAEEKVDKMEHGIDKLEEKIDNKTQDAKSWWHTHHDKIDGEVIERVKETKAWVGSKLSETDDTLDNISAKTTGAVKGVVKDAKEWVEDKTKVIDRKIGGIPKEADSWWKSSAVPKLMSKPEENTSSWFRRRSESELTHKNPWLGMSESPDYWSNGEEQGTAKIRDDNDPWFHRTSVTYFQHDPNGSLDNKDVDRWSTNGEEIGTAHLDIPKYEIKHRHRAFVDFHPRGPEYWSNGEEISSADIRDETYYSYPGSRMAPSLFRTSWWDRRTQPLASDYTSGASPRKDQGDKELLSKDIRESTDIRAAAAASAALLKAKMEKTIHEIQDTLVHEQVLAEQTMKQMEARYASERDSAERLVSEAKARAKAWEKEQHVRAKKDANAIEERVVQDKLAADRAVADAKARADAWAHEQKDKADQVAKDTKSRLLQEVATAEKNAKEAKARADAWGREQKGRAEQIAKETYNHVLQEVATAEKNAKEAKDRAEAWAREQKEKATLAAKAAQSRILQEIADAEKKAKEAKATLESKIQAEKIRAEKAARELEQKMELKRAQAEKAARDGQIKLEAEIQAKKLAAEKAAQDMVARARAAEEKAAREFEMRLAREREEAAAAEKKRAAELEAKKMADKLAFEKAQAEALAAKRRAEATEHERKLHTDLAAKELEHMKEIERAEAEARNVKARAEALFMEKKAAAERAMKEMEERLSAERAEAAAREAKAHAEALALEKKMKETRSTRELEYERSLEQAEAAARNARIRAEALLREKMAVAETASREMQQKLSLEKAEAEALEAKKRAESLLAETRRAAEHSTRSSSGWGWPWSSSKSAESNIDAERTSTRDTREGYDTTGRLLEHVAKDIKQTKEDVQDGVERLKDTVLGAGRKASDAGSNVRDNLRETARTKAETTAPERRGLFVSGAKAGKVSDIGVNVEATAKKAEVEVDIKKKASSKDTGSTAKKAYDNVIDAATTVEGQIINDHHHHEHSADVSGSHHLADHIRDDLRQTKEDIQYGMEHLKDTVFGVEDESKKRWSSKTEKLDGEMNKAQANISKAATESKSWWSSKTREAENKTGLLDSELRAGLNKAGDKLREMDRGLGEDLKTRKASDDDEYWFREEQAGQQHSQARRGSGRAM